MSYATTTALNTEIKNRKAGDTYEAKARDTAIAAAIAAHEAKYHQPPAPAPTLTVATIPALLAALAVDANTDITLAPGRYPGGVAIDARFAARTKPVTVHTEGCWFDDGAITFEGGAHDQTWPELNLDNWAVPATGVVVFGGHPDEAAPHHIAIGVVNLGPNLTAATDNNSHGVYFAHALGGPHDLTIGKINHVANATKPLASVIHVYHSDAANPNCWNVAIGELNVTGAIDQAIRMWDGTIHDWKIGKCSIHGSRIAVRLEEIRLNPSIVIGPVSTDGEIYSSDGSDTRVTFLP